MRKIVWKYFRTLTVSVLYWQWRVSNHFIPWIVTQIIYFFELCFMRKICRGCKEFILFISHSINIFITTRIPRWNFNELFPSNCVIFEWTRWILEMCATYTCLIPTVLKIVLAAWTLLLAGIISNGMGKEVFLARESWRWSRKWERISLNLPICS